METQQLRDMVDKMEQRALEAEGQLAKAQEDNRKARDLIYRLRDALWVREGSYPLTNEARDFLDRRIIPDAKP